MKNKKLTIALIVILALVIAGVACRFIFCKSSPEKEESSTDSVVTTDAPETETADSEIITDAQEEETTTDAVTADTEDAQEETGNGEDTEVALKIDEYRIIETKVFGFTDEEQWELVKYDHDEAQETGTVTTHETIARIDESLASQMNGYEYSYIIGYYYKDAFYTSIISDKVLKINRLDLTKDEMTYDVFVDLPMPEGYELSGLWEGERLNNDDSATILYMNDDNIYFHVIGESYTEDIYLYRIADQSITKLDSSFRNGPHSRPKPYKYDHYLILLEDSGYYVIDETVPDVFETIYTIEQYTGTQFGPPRIKGGELYFDVNPWNENPASYKYNFETKTLTKAN